MAPVDIVIVGAGGSGRETYGLLRDIEKANPGTWNFRGFVAADAPDQPVLDRLGEPFLGDPAGLVERIPQAAGWQYALGIGSGAHRRAMDETLIAQGLRPATLIHPTAIIGLDVELGPGAVISPFTIITTNVRIGASLQMHVFSGIGHDVRVGDYVTFSPYAVATGQSTIGDGASLFTKSTISPGCSVGARAVVGTGAVVLRDVPDDTTVVGLPARPMG